MVKIRPLAPRGSEDLYSGNFYGPGSGVNMNRLFKMRTKQENDRHELRFKMGASRAARKKVPISLPAIPEPPKKS